MDKTLKIAVNTRFLIKDQLEGIGNFTNETLKWIVNKNPQHQFYFLFDRDFDESFIFNENIIPIKINPPARHPILWYYWFEQSLPKILSKIKADVFVSTDGFASLKSNTPSLSVFYDLAFEHYPKYVPFATRWFYKKYTPLYANKVNRIATISEFSKNDIINKYGINADKIDVVYCGSKQNKKTSGKKEKNSIQLKYANGNPFFLFVSAVHPRKNLERILLAFDELKQTYKKPIDLVVAGRMAWQNEKLKSIVKQLKNKSNIHFVGRLPNEAIEKLYANAEALVYPSLFEGFGLPILEAMYAETPVITSNVSSMPEVAGNAALLVNPLKYESIKEAMLRILTEDGLAKDLVEKGKLQREKFKWENTAEKLWNSIMKVVEDTKN